MFQLTAARRRLDNSASDDSCKKPFQLTAARRRLDIRGSGTVEQDAFQLTAARRRLVAGADNAAQSVGGFNSQPPEGGWCGLSGVVWQHGRFNSQPPEGGWWHQPGRQRGSERFNSQPPEGGWLVEFGVYVAEKVSTHSRPKAAGAATETLGPQGLHRPVSLRFHRRHMALLYHSQVRPVFSKLLKKSSRADLRAF